MSRSFVPWEDIRAFCFDEILNINNDILFEVYKIIAREKVFLRIGKSYTRWTYLLQRKAWQKTCDRQLKLFQ